MVEQSAVNRSVVGSSPTFGATLERLCIKRLQKKDWPLSVKVLINRRLKSLFVTTFQKFIETRRNPPYHAGVIGLFSRTKKQPWNGGSFFSVAHSKTAKYTSLCLWSHFVGKADWARHASDLLLLSHNLFLKQLVLQARHSN